MKPRYCLTIFLLFLFSLSFLALTTSPASATGTGTHIFITAWDGSSFTSPSQVVEIPNANATRHSFQAHCFRTTQGNTFVWFFNQTCKAIQWVASANLTTWTSAVNHTLFSAYPFGSFDVEYPELQTAYNGCIQMTTSDGVASNWYPFTISDLTLTKKSGGSLGAFVNAHSPSVCSNLAGNNDYATFFRTSPNKFRLHKSPTNQIEISSLIPYSTTSGGAQILSWKSSSPYHMLMLCKGGNETLYHGIFNITSGSLIGSMQSLGSSVVLASGFDSFCATTEVIKAGDPENVHLVYKNSTGQLMYCWFNSSAQWTSPTSIYGSDAGLNFTTIAIDKNGKLLASWIGSDKKVYYMTKSGSTWSSASMLSGDYANATYLSGNHKAQNGSVLLMWTANPYTAPPVVYLTETEIFIRELRYGDLAWLYIILFLGIGFIISWMVRPFALIMVVACLYQAIDYATIVPNTPHIYKIVIFFVAMWIFLFRLANVWIFGRDD